MGLDEDDRVVLDTVDIELDHTLPSHLAVEIDDELVIRCEVGVLGGAERRLNGALRKRGRALSVVEVGIDRHRSADRTSASAVYSITTADVYIKC